MMTDRKPDSKPMHHAKERSRRPATDAAEDPIQRAIGDKLKAVFEAVTEQTVPTRFAALLRRLEEQEREEK